MNRKSTMLIIGYLFIVYCAFVCMLGLEEDTGRCWALTSAVLSLGNIMRLLDFRAGAGADGG